MQKPLFYTLLFCLITACTVDYDLKQTNIDEPNRLVVNSFLNPEKPVCVYFYTIDRTDTGFVYHTAENLHVRLMEDDHVLFDGLCADTMLVFVLAYSVLNGDSLVKSFELFASNVLLDVINRSNASQLKDEDVGSSYYEEYMRIKNRNITYLDNLIFIARMHGDGTFQCVWLLQSARADRLSSGDGFLYRFSEFQ